MFKRNLTKITVVSLLAAVMGVTAGRFYAGAIANTANAESGVAETVPNAPTWQDLHVLYFGRQITRSQTKNSIPATSLQK
jgi:hypothetical protein